MKRNTTLQLTEQNIEIENGCVQLSEDDFAAQFRPLRNHIDPHASYDWGDGYGTLFETFGEELEFVMQQPSQNVWTLLSLDTGDYTASGLHFVNRYGYFVCEVPTPEGVMFEVALTGVDD